MSALPVAVIGAGPQGLAAAAHLVERGEEAIVIERGDAAAAAVSEWGHVRLFSAWPELIDTAARRLLEPLGWKAPAAGYPTGADWVREYLAPLADALGTRVQYSTTVTGISRQGRDKVVDRDRAQNPFVVHTVGPDGRDSRILARAVIDASGTWTLPGPAGSDGLPAIGEERAAVSYRIPDDVSELAGTHVVVIGAGHSASHTVLRLSELVRRAPGTRVSWLLRRGSAANVFGGGDGELTVVSEDGREIAGVGHVFALTGFRPDTGMLRELRIDLDPALEAVAGIAAEIDPNIHSCGSVAATGARELAQPEDGLFIVGAKSYGRAPTFLALTGYEQVRSVAASLAGDHEAAARNELVLPATGVCGGAGDFDAGGGCCAAPSLVQIGGRPELQVIS